MTIELPQDRPATGNMLSATNIDGHAFNTRSRMAQCTSTEDATSQPQSNAVTLNVTDTTSTTPKSLTTDRLQALLQMQKTDPFCKQISKSLSNRKAPKHKADLLHVKRLLYKHITDSNQKFLALVIPKEWKCTVLVEAHDKLGHQGANCQYHWKAMNKDIRKYIAQCTLCHREKAKVQTYPLQMTKIPECTFDKIAIDLVTECETFSSGNKHILTIIDHLKGWPEAFPIPKKSADIIVSSFISHHLPVHMCPRYILSDNGTAFKNHLMDQVLQQLGIGHIFSTPYHPQSNRKLEVFHKYFKHTLKKLCEKDPSYWDKYINQVIASYRVTPNLTMTDTPFFLIYGRDPNLPLHQLLEPMQGLLEDLESGLLNLESHCLALAIAKKTLDENCFRTAQKTTDRESPSFKIGNRVYFKNKLPGKWDLKWRPGYRIVHIECNGHYLHIENQATGKT